MLGEKTGDWCAEAHVGRFTRYYVNVICELGFGMGARESVSYDD